jgi:hypothetical protein
MLDEKANNAKFYDPILHMDNIPKIATKDTTDYDLSWSGRYFNSFDPLRPLLLDDSSELENLPKGRDVIFKDILR